MKYAACTVRGLPSATTKRNVEDHFSLPPDSQCVVGPVVDLQDGTRLTTVIFRKEKSGLKRSCEDLIKAFNRSSFRGGSNTISVKDDFRGLTPLSGAVNAPIHVYFVHGLGGHAFNSWCSNVVRNDIGTLKCWPRDLLPQRLKHEDINARIYTLGYNANSVKSATPNATISTHAENLLSHLLADQSTEPPSEIYFVCHSLGGLIVCEALVMALYEDEDYGNKHKGLFSRGGECLVKGICFMGTPFYGSGRANTLVPFVRALEEVNFISAVNATILRSLKENEKESVELRNIVQRFKTIAEKRSIRLLIGCEQKTFAGSSLVVGRQSAIAIFGDIATVFEIDDDHRGIIKYDSPHTGYKTLESLIVKLIKNRLNLEMLPTERPSYDLAHRGKPSSSTQAQPNRNPFPPFESQGIIQNHIYIQDHLNLRPFTREYGQPHSNPPNPPQRSQTDFQRIPAPNDHDPLNRLKLFDTKFIVDDTGSMNLSIDQSNPYARSRWDVTVEALGHIAEIAARYDEDGIDIRFLKEQKLDEDRITSGDRVRELLGKIDVDTHSGGTEFQDQLEEALDPHLEKYGEYLRQKADSKQNAHRDSGIRAPKRPKSLNLIVITDGEADDEQEVEEYIVSVAKRLDDWDAPAAYVGIQFVQVGDDARATIFLQRLDDELKNREPHIRRDIVDTIPFNRAVGVDAISFTELLEKKVLLGAVTRKIDELKDEIWS